MELTQIPQREFDFVRAGKVLDGIVRSSAPFDISCVTLYWDHAPSKVVYQNLGKFASPTNISFLSIGAYTLDPVYRHFLDRDRSRFLSGQELWATNIFGATALPCHAFHPLVSLQAGVLNGHVGFMCRIDGIGVGYSLIRTADGSQFSEQEEEALRELEHGLLPMLKRFAINHIPETDAQRAKDEPENLEDLLAVDLPPRQRAVVSLSLQGFALKDIGRKLDISPNTARAHLQGAYRRLGVNSRSEIFAIILRRMGVHVAISVQDM